LLNRVFATLRENRWFDTEQPFEYSINLTRGACVWLLLTRQGISEQYVKFSQFHPLAQEAQRTREASVRYPTFAPLFVGHVQSDGLDVLTCKAVEALAVTPSDVRHSARGAALLRHLEAYFEATRVASLGPGRPDSLPCIHNRDLEGPLAHYFQQGPLAAIAQRWLSGSAMSVAQALPDMPQHGDLVLNNVGVCSPHRIVLFDWEDFGVSSLPGLDLFTFELSLADDPARLLEMRQDEMASVRRHKVAACRAIGIDIGDFHALTPVYALMFRYLKRNYGPWVRERMDRLLLSLDRA
jgi:hypothetical protein